MVVESEGDVDKLDEFSCDAKSAWRVEGLNCVVELLVDEEEAAPPVEDVKVVPAFDEEGVVPPVEGEEFVLPVVPDPVVDVVPADGVVDDVGSALFVTAKTKNSGDDPELAPELPEAWGSRACRSA